MKLEKLTREQRRNIFHDIQCIPGCANCCPTTCCELNQKTRLCMAHPTIIGEEKAFWRRGQGCGKTIPITAFVDHYYCPPVVDRIQQELSIRIEPEVSFTGTVMMKNAKQVLKKTREIRGWPSTNRLHSLPQAFFNLFVHSE